MNDLKNAVDFLKNERKLVILTEIQKVLIDYSKGKSNAVFYLERPSDYNLIKNNLDEFNCNYMLLNGRELVFF